MANNTRLASDTRDTNKVSLVDRMDHILVGFAGKWKLLVCVFGSLGVAYSAFVAYGAWQNQQAQDRAEAFFAATWGENIDSAVLSAQAQDLLHTPAGARAMFALVDSHIAVQDYAAAQAELAPWRTSPSLPTLLQVRIAETDAYLYEMQSDWRAAGDAYYQAYQLATTESDNLRNAVRNFTQAGESTRVQQILSASDADTPEIAALKRSERIAQELGL